jgi:hypothetical protein
MQCIFERGIVVDQYNISSTAWQKTVGQLDVGCAHQLAAHVRQIVSSHVSSHVSWRNEAISVVPLDRISPRTATVSWSDPQGCKYGEQVWRLAAAKRAGTCVLTGQPIAAGEAIYTKVDPPPTNANAMMLAVALDEVLSD